MSLYDPNEPTYLDPVALHAEHDRHVMAGAYGIEY